MTTYRLGHGRPTTLSIPLTEPSPCSIRELRAQPLTTSGRRQLFGHQYGLAPSSLDRENKVRGGQTVFMKRQCYTRSEGSQKFRWIDGKLFLSRTRTVFLTDFKEKKRHIGRKALQHFVFETNAVVYNQRMMASDRAGHPQHRHRDCAGIRGIRQRQRSCQTGRLKPR
ncbi:hypothetical protein F4678DRAFT_451708 [Xylaria arbuscula]|nr:hypothetical protein F4678DRAFT_451708 [Xylaria arbuscula]